MPYGVQRAQRFPTLALRAVFKQLLLEFLYIQMQAALIAVGFSELLGSYPKRYFRFLLLLNRALLFLFRPLEGARRAAAIRSCNTSQRRCSAMASSCILLYSA